MAETEPTNTTPASAPLPTEEEDISKETLMALLKDKSKEIKVATTKLTKLEEKYVKNYKEYKLLKKDHESFARLLREHVFSAEPAQLAATLAYGEFDFDMLLDLWNKREQHVNQATTTLLAELNAEKQQDRVKYEQLTEELAKQVKQATAQSNLSETIKKYEHQLYELQDTNSKQAEEISELRDMLSTKSDQIAALRKIEEQMHQHKAELLLKELQSNSQSDSLSVQKKIQQSNSLNEVLKVKNLLENALESNQQLEQKLAKADQDNVALQEQVQSLTAQIHAIVAQPPSPKQVAQLEQNSTSQEESKLQTNHSPKEVESQKLSTSSNGGSKKALEEISATQLKGLMNDNSSVNNSFQDNSKVIEVSPSSSFTNVIMQAQTPTNSSQLQNFSQLNQTETINLEYLKNVILKYFIYQEGRAYNESSMLMTAIMTILKMSKEDREKVYLARQNATLWNSTKTFISNTFTFSGGQPQFDMTQPKK